MAVREQYEVVIVGGGPAGLCAALYGGRGMLRTVLLERGVPGGELLNTEWIEDYPGFPKVKGRELAALMTQHALQFGAEIRQENAESIVRRPDGIFEVTTSLGHHLRGARPSSSRPAARRSSSRFRASSNTPGAVCRTVPCATAPSSRARRSRWWAVVMPPSRRPTTSRATPRRCTWSIAAANCARRRSCRSGCSGTRRSRWSGTSACSSCSATRPASRPLRSRTRRPACSPS